MIPSRRVLSTIPKKILSRPRIRIPSISQIAAVAPIQPPPTKTTTVVATTTKEPTHLTYNIFKSAHILFPHRSLLTCATPRFFSTTVSNSKPSAFTDDPVLFWESSGAAGIAKQRYKPVSNSVPAAAARSTAGPVSSSASSSASSSTPSLTFTSPTGDASSLPHQGGAVVSPPPDMDAVSVGEDSYVLAYNFIGVADGVGGWASVPEANAGLYAQWLLHNCLSSYTAWTDAVEDGLGVPVAVDPTSDFSTSATSSSSSSSYSLPSSDPFDIVADTLAPAYDALPPSLIGSATIVIAALRDNTLHIAQLGDCGICIVRGSSLIFRSEEQQHTFNFPRQLGSAHHDLPHHSIALRIRVKPGDVVIMASDGLFDNLDDAEIVETVYQIMHSSSSSPSSSMTFSAFHSPSLSPSKKPHTPAELIAAALMKSAHDLSSDQRYHSPFSVKAHANGIPYMGGKPDDITVVACVIGELGSTRHAQ